MVFLVPFDGSDLAASALVRAVEFDTVLEEGVLVVSIIPKGNSTYARKQGWIEADEEFDRQAVVARLHEQVTDIAPSAEYRHKTVSKYTPPGGIASRIKDIAIQVDASMIFIGSENAGRIVSGVGSIGARVAAEDSYDVVIVRNRELSELEQLKEHSPYREPKSAYKPPDD